MSHLDLKLENVLLDENKELKDLKVIDFGLCRPFQQQSQDNDNDVNDNDNENDDDNDNDDTQQTEVFTDLVGSPTYISPQIIEGSYTYKADIWACGVIAYTLLAGFTPFDGPNEGCTMEVSTVQHVNIPYIYIIAI